MANMISQLIAKTIPRYIENTKELIEEYGSISDAPLDKIKPKAEIEHKLVYESYAQTETLEPIYYFVLDLMNDFRLNPEKLIDNFSPTPGSTQFVELGERAIRMQQQASQSLGALNAVLKSILNLIYGLKDFNLRMRSYEQLKSPDKKISNGAKLALKQIWMDKVDVSKGNSSIKGLAISQGGAFSTIIDAFLISDTVQDVLKLDLNDIVKRILVPRIQEFNQWLEESEKVLKTRYEIERNYLKSQVNNLKLYSRWTKPYLLAAQQLEASMSKNAALVKTFNRTILELTLFGKSPVKAEDVLPPALKNKSVRDYNTCVLVDFTFNAAPIQGGRFMGRVEVSFKGYALNDDEVAKFKQEFEKSDTLDALKLIEGITDESLNKIQQEIDFFLNEKTPEEKAKEEKEASEESNPFLALFGFYNKKPEKKKEEGKKKEITDIRPDNWMEKEYLRPAAEESTKEITFKLFDLYKKAHGMPSYS